MLAFLADAASEVSVVVVEAVEAVEAAEVVLLAEPATCIAKTPPKGPAGLGFAILTRQTFDMPPTVPEQVVPAGIWTVNGC